MLDVTLVKISSQAKTIVTVGHLPPPITGENLCRLRLEQAMAGLGWQVDSFRRTFSPALWFCRSRSVVVVNGQSLPGTLYDMLIAFWMCSRGASVWFYFHNAAWKRFTQLPFALMMRAVGRARVRMLVLTGQIAEELRRSGYDVSILRNSGGADFDELMERRTGRAAASKCLLWMGRLDEAKGFSLALAAFEILFRADPEWRFEVYGSDGRGYRAVPGVYFHGFVRGLEKLSAFVPGRIFVLPSRSEVQPLAIIEALAAGFPIVASAAGGIPEMLSDARGDAGIVLEHGQQKAELYAAAIQRVSSRYAEYSASARRIYLERFSYKLFTGRVKEILGGGEPRLC